MKKTFLTLLMVILLTGMIASSCAAPAPAPAPTPTPAPAPAPAPQPAPAPAPEAKPIELKLAHNSVVKSNSHANFMVPWAKQIEEAANGRVKITIYPTETLCKAKETVVATMEGITDIAWVLVAFYPGRFPLCDVTGLPFLNLPGGTIDGRELGPGGINSHIIQELYNISPEIQAEWSDVKLLVIHTSGPTFPFTKEKPVRTLDELKGLKIRSYSGPETGMWQMLEAAPVSIPLPAVYEAVEKGVLDACNTDWGGIGPHRLFEVLHHKTNIELTLGRFALIMNQEKWNSLPPDIQEIIMSYSGISGAEMAGDALCGAQAIDRVRNQAKEAGYPIEEVDLEPGELEKWKRMVQPMYDKWVADMESKGLAGQKVLDEALRLIEKYK